MYSGKATTNVLVLFNTTVCIVWLHTRTDELAINLYFSEIIDQVLRKFCYKNLDKCFVIRKLGFWTVCSHNTVYFGVFIDCNLALLGCFEIVKRLVL